MIFNKTLMVLCLCVFYLSTKACDICGNYMGITPYDNKHSVSFLHRYRAFNGYKNYQKQSALFATNAYKITHGEKERDSTKTTHYSANDFESFKVFELRFKYFILKRLEINTFLPLVNNKTKFDNQYTSHVGLGDVAINIGYHCITPKDNKRIRHKLILGTGIKLPTGNYAIKDQLNERLEFETQAGTGTIDGIGYINYTAMSKRIGFNIALNYKVSNTNIYLERLANSSSNFASLFIKFSHHNFTFYPSLQANYEHTKGLYINKQLINNSQMNALLIGPGLDVYYKAFSINASYQLTAYEQLNAGYLKNAGRIVLGLNYSFSKKD